MAKSEMVRAGFLIRKELKQGVEEYAEENCITASAVYNLAVKNFLENEQMKKMLFTKYDQKDFIDQVTAAFAKASIEMNSEKKNDSFLDSQIGA